jgi:hypothetical protein
MDIIFSMDGEVNLLALYAAVLSTFIAVWEILKWRARNAVLITCNSNMLFIPSPDDKKYIIVNVTNKGDTQTTITHFLGYYWPSRVDKILNRNVRAFVVNSPDVPKIIQPGEQWMGQAHQDENMEKMAKEGLLYMGIIHSMGKKEILKRVKISENSVQM